MKRVLYMVGVTMMFGCGMLKTGRTPASEQVESVIGSYSTTNVAVKEVVNAFTKEDLYRSREENLKARRNKDAAARVSRKKTRVESTVEQEEQEAVSQKSIVEIIQIIDNSGAVVATKRIK